MLTKIHSAFNLSLLIAAVLLLTACSLVSRYSVYPVKIGETDPVSVPLSAAQIQSRLDAAYRRWQGTPYRFGHQLPGLAADCSGFTQSVFSNRFDVKLPRTTRAQINLGQRVRLSKARAGDLVFFNLGNGYGHVGIYLGNDIVLQATTTKGVTKTNLNTSRWWAGKVFMVKRIIE